MLSIALLLIFANPAPGASLYGSLGVIVVACLIRFMTAAARPVMAAYAQPDRRLDDASCVRSSRRNAARVSPR